MERRVGKVCEPCTIYSLLAVGNQEVYIERGGGGVGVWGCGGVGVRDREK
jgi:hypothetical protein